MSITSVMSDSSSPSRLSDFIRRLLGCMLFVLGIAAFMALMNRYQVNLDSFWMNVFSILMLGLAIGAAPRANFYAWSGFIQFLTLLILLPFGLFALGFFTNWQMGLGPLQPWFEGRMDQDQLIQLGAAFLIATIALEAWRGKSRASTVRDNNSRDEKHQAQSRRPEAVPLVVQPSRSSRTSSERRSTSKSQPFLKFMKAPKTKIQNHSRSSAQAKSRFGFRQLFKHKPNIQVSLYEAHRCPYCLEEVKQNDARGVKRCEVCNTLHHADCWEVTGVCQVPHLNT